MVSGKRSEGIMTGGGFDGSSGFYELLSFLCMSIMPVGEWHTSIEQNGEK